MKKLFFVLSFLFLTSTVYAQTGQVPHSFSRDACIWWEDESKNVTNPACLKMIVPDGTLVNNMDGSYSLNVAGTLTINNSPGGSNTQVQFNDSSSFGGDAGLTYNKTTDVLTAAGGFVGDLTGNVTGDLTGNADTATSATTATNVADADKGDISISSGVWSVDANSVALGTDTTGGYAASTTEGGGATSLEADAVDALTEIAQGIKTAANDTSKLVVGTAGSENEIAKWNTDGTLTDSNVIFGTMTDGKWCSYASSGTLLSCTEDAPAGSGDITAVGSVTSGDVLVASDDTATLTGSLSIVGTIHVNGENVCTEDGTNCPASGSGDVESAGDCTSGACLDGTSDGGTYVRLYDGDSHYLQLDPLDLSANRTASFLDVTGTVVIDTATQTLTNKTIGTGNTVTINASDITDQNAGTDITADLEEETHASEHASGGGDAVDHDGLTNFVANEHIDWTGVDFLVGTATGLTSNEIVAGTSPGGELGGTWGTPTIDDTGITLTSITIGSLLGVDSIDATGAVDMDYGSADITDHTFTSDGGAVVIDGSASTFPGLTSTGTVVFDNQFGVQFEEASGNGDNYVAFRAAATLGGDVVFVLGDDLRTCAAGEVIEIASVSGASITLECDEDGGGGGSASGKEYYWPAAATLPLEAAESIPPISKDAGTNFDVLSVDFNDSTDECRSVTFRVPATINTGGTATFGTSWYSAATTTGNIIMDFRHNSGVAEGVDPDQSATVETATADAVQGTAGQITITTWTETISNLAWAANDVVVAAFCRDANNASDTLSNDSKHLEFWVIIP